MIKNIILGIKEDGGAFALISKLKLWKYFIIPVFISIFTAVLMALEAYILSDNIGSFISKAWIWDWGKETFTGLSNFFGAVIIIILGLIVYKHIILAFSAPFMGIVSEKIEFHLYGDVKHLHRKSSFFEQLIRGIRINIRNLSDFNSEIYSHRKSFFNNVIVFIASILCRFWKYGLYLRTSF